MKPEILTLHSDRGSPMTAKCTAQLLADLGVTQSLSRPRVSDDNPFSEAQFKTLKYHPGFPGRFDNQSHAIDYCRNFFPWYNHGHRHSGIATLTPADVYLGAAQTMLNDRRCVLEAAYNKNPERFPLGMPQPADLPQAVYINPPLERQYRGDCSLNSTTKCLKVVDRFRHIPLIIVFGRFTTGIHVHIQLASTLEGAGCINGTTLIDQQRAIDSSASPFFVAHTARHFVCFAQS